MATSEETSEKKPVDLKDIDAFTRACRLLLKLEPTARVRVMRAVAILFEAETPREDDRGRR